MKLTGIYKISSQIHPERIYIGSAVNIYSRWSIHRSDLHLREHGNSRLQNHYNKYGKENLTYVIIESCLPEDLIRREQYYIDTLNPFFNICKIAGSQLGTKRSEEQKLYMKERSGMKGKVPWNKGKTGIFSEEVLVIMRAAAKDRTFPTITRKKISDSHTNVPLSAYHVEQTRRGLTGKPKSKEHIINNVAAHKKPIFQYDLNMNFIREWDFTVEVTRELGISNFAISQCLIGKSKTSGGFIWGYKFDKGVA